MSNDKCRCGYKETAKHLLLECKEYREERKALLYRIKEKLEVRSLTLPLILHTIIGISNLLVFLKETSICTRKWYLSRIEEEEEEEEVDEVVVEVEEEREEVNDVVGEVEGERELVE